MANRATDTLFRYFQQNQGIEEFLEAKNMRIFYCLQSLLTKTYAFSSFSTHIAFLKYVIIYKTYTFP